MKKEVEACDLCEGQTVFWNGKHRVVESVEIDSGRIFTVEVKFEGEEETVKFTEGDFLPLLEGPMVEGMLLTLKDCCDGSETEGNTVNINIQADERWIWIGAEGYGEMTAEDGHGYPIGLEFYNGQLRLIVRPDINIEDPQIIVMENARESNRRE